MKKNIAMRVASLVLMCTIVTSCFVSSTFAKYTSSISGQDTVTVAKWAIEVNDVDAVAQDSVSFDLFSTIKDSDATSAEADVADGKIAPGTSGAFDLKIENLSEVTATYNVAFAFSNGANIPIQYSLDGDDWNASLSNVANNIAAGGSTTVKVYWKWPFDGNDTTDTALGAQAPTLTVTATITATQVD